MKIIILSFNSYLPLNQKCEIIEEENEKKTLSHYKFTKDRRNQRSIIFSVLDRNKDF